MLYPARMYPAHFQHEEGAIVVTFRDVPEAITQGDDEIDAVCMAVDALNSSKDFYLEDFRKMAEPSAALPGEVLIPLYLSDLAQQIALYSTPKRSGMTVLA